MMATEHTPNYNLDLYASADKPNLRDQYNAAMGKIDTQMKKSADDVTNANANVLTLQTQMTEAQKDIAELESTVDEHGTEITNVQKTANDALSLAQTNESEIETTQGTVTSLTSRVVAVEGTANAASTKADAATETSQSALAKASTAQSAAESATQTAANASSSAAVAQETAAQANNTANALKNQTNLVNFYNQDVACWGGTVNVSGWYSPISHLVTVRAHSDGQLPSMPKGFSQTNIGTLPAGFRPTVEMRGTGEADVISGIAYSLKIAPTGALTITASHTADVGASYVAATATYFVIPATQSVSALAEASDAVDFYENSYPTYLDASQQASALAHADALLRYEETIAELTARIEKLEAR